MSGDALLDIGRAVAALVFVIALMGGLSFLLKKFGLSAQASGGSSGRKRLKIIESLPLDARRRLVLLQCDGTQHLVILGPGGETVVKTDIPSNDCTVHAVAPVDVSVES